MNIKYIEQTIVRDKFDTIYARLLTLYHLYNDGSPESVAKMGKIDDAIKAEEFLQAENLKEFRRILSVAIQLCGEREIIDK